MATLIDCGTNLGQGLEKVSKLEGADASWKVYSFEANPNTFKRLVKRDNVIYHNKAVSDSYASCVFNCEEWVEEADHIGGGSTLMELDHWKTERVYGNRPKYVQVMVESIDLGAFMSDLRLNDRECVMKMDIEGSEYVVLQRLRDLGLLSKISRLYIEFHDHILSAHPTGNGADYWMTVLQNHGVDVVRWY